MDRLSRSRAGSAVLTAISLLGGIFGAGALGDLATPYDDRVLIATFAASMGLFGAVLAQLARREPWAWLVLWSWPVFLALHVLLLGTLLPDGPLMLLAVAALLALWPRAAVHDPVSSVVG